MSEREDIVAEGIENAWLAEQPVRDLAQAIADGSPFVDADAIRVARAFLQQHEEEA